MNDTPNQASRDKTLLFIGAHPDDETFGPGGTLAYYAARGVKVYYACATRGEAGSSAPQYLQGFNSMGDMRWAELEQASRELGLAGVIHLGYRDSGMSGAADNRHPCALIGAPTEQVARRILEVFAEIKPQVVITHDPQGGYRHPDHIAVNKAVALAFQMAGEDIRPQKLYYTVTSDSTLKIMVKLMPLLGRDPQHYGRNKDIDLTDLVHNRFPVHAAIRYGSTAAAKRDKATARYRSQVSGRRQGIFRLLDRAPWHHDLFMQAYPPVTGKLKVKDLFDGVGPTSLAKKAAG
jgi:LmbE family N-acetylglucosaminyl deacetylase